jgi:MscS family membrane protein
MFFCLFTTQELAAQVRQRNPREAIETHLKYLQPEYKNQGVQYLNYSAAIFNNPRLSDNERKIKERRLYARLLQEIYNGIGERIRIDEIPDNPNYTDSVQGNKAVYFVSSHLGYDIYLEKIDRNWYYSVETIRNIQRLHGLVFVIDTRQLFGIDLFDPPQTYFGLTFWQYVGFMVLLLISTINFLILRFLLIRIPVSMLKKYGHDLLAENYVRPVVRPLAGFLLFAQIRLMLPILLFPISISEYLFPAMYIIMLSQIILVVYNLVNILGYYASLFSSKGTIRLEQQLILFIKRTLRVIVVITGGMVLLQHIGLNITGLIAGLSIGGLAVALAAQDMLKNIFGSLMIFLDRPFKIGDWIIGDRIEGRVEQVGFRSTRIRTFHNSVTSIPNGKIADMTIDNMGMRMYHRYRTVIAITYDTPADLIETFVEGLREIANRHPLVLKENIQAYLNNFGSSSLDVHFQIFFLVDNIFDELKNRQEIMLEIVRLAEFLGVRFAFPTTSVHVENLPGAPSLTPVYHKNRSGFQRDLQDFFQKSPPEQ